MRTLYAFVRRLVSAVHRRGWERDLNAELEANLRLHIEDNMRSGMAPDEARRAAVLKFGGLEAAKESYRDRKGLPFLDSLLQDLRYASRTLRSNAGFATVAVLTLALGIGATTAMFSVVQAVLWRPLPYSQPDRLVEISETNPLKKWTHAVAAPANFADWQKMNSVFSGIAGYTARNRLLTSTAEPSQLKTVAATGNLFEVLGVAPLLGRTFRPEETFAGKDAVAVLSYNFWQAQFARDPRILGQTILLTDKKYEVIGVMPPSFFFPNRETQVFIPLGFDPSVFVRHRRPHYLDVIARLRPGTSLDQAAQQMTAIAARLEETYPDTNTKMGVRLDGFHETLVSEKRLMLVTLLAAVGFLFLIVCSNVANLQLGRAAARMREMTIRRALGAGRARLIRQLLTESLLLSIVGGVLGFALATVAGIALPRFAPSAIPPFAEVRMDGWVILFNTAITICAPLLFGIVPALSSSRSETLATRTETTSRGGRSMRNVLVGAEVALSVVLVVGAGLLIRSLVRLESVDPGFVPDRAVSFEVLLPGSRYPKGDQVVRTIEEMENRIRKQPQIEAVGTTLAIPLRGSAWTGDATVEGRPAGEYERELRRNVITPDVFRAMGTPLLRGRFLNEHDTAASPAVTLVNEALANAYFRGEDPIGRRLKFGRPTDKDGWVIVVGVVADQKQDAMDARVQPESYTPLAQSDADGGLRVTFVVRGAAGADHLASIARREIRSIDSGMVLTNVTSMRELVYASVGDQRFRTSLLTGFAGIALLLAALGVYGVLAYSVLQRRREIGIRMALGASTAPLIRMVVMDGMAPVAAGAALGLAVAYATAHLIESLLFGVTPVDLPTYLLTLGVLIGVALCACTIPAVRAIHVNPVTALREQ